MILARCIPNYRKFSSSICIKELLCSFVGIFTECVEMAEDTSQVLETSLKNNIKSDCELDNVEEKVEATVLESPKCKRDFDSSQSEQSSRKAEGETEPKKKALFG